MVEKFKVLVSYPVLNVSLATCEEIVSHRHLMALHHQHIDKMRTHKASATCHLVKEINCHIIGATHPGASIWGVRGSLPPDFEQEVVGGSQGVMKYYYIFIMYRKYVQKW